MSDRKSLLATISFTTALLLAGTTLAAASAEKVLYSFKGGDDGANPQAPLVADAAGNLYGTTGAGGSSNCAGGCGTVFMLTPPARRNGAWTETVLYRFLGGNDAAGPLAGLIFDKAGNLYGATLSGGGTNDGAVFELSPPAAPGGAWTETVLYGFRGEDDGEYPIANLTFDAAGNLYGTTLYGGGAQRAGTVFQLTPPSKLGGVWTESILHRFGKGKDGANPIGSLLIDRNGALYGTTMGAYNSDGPVFFRLRPPAPGGKWTESLLYQFNGQSQGDWLGDLIFRAGHLYGTAQLGGDVDNSGTVFELTPPSPAGVWSEATIHNFAGGDDGNLPNPRLVADHSGNLYGTSQGGNPGYGTVFKLSPPAAPGGAWVKTTLHQFTSGGDGSGPGAGLIFGKRGALYGTTLYGGTSDNGTVYAIAP